MKTSDEPDLNLPRQEIAPNAASLRANDETKASPECPLPNDRFSLALNLIRGELEELEELEETEELEMPLQTGNNSLDEIANVPEYHECKKTSILRN